MVFQLKSCVFQIFVSFGYKIIELLKPFSDDSKYTWCFNEKDSILYFKITILRRVFWYFPTNSIMGVAFNLFSVLVL